MGIRKWFNRAERPHTTHLPTSAASAPVPVLGEPVKMAGTTTHGAAGAGALFHGRGKYTGGLLELAGQLVPEPENPADPSAVAVHVEGDRVGYLPGYRAGQLALAPGDPLPCQVQLWGAVDRGQLRVIGWVAQGTGHVAWPHTAQNPPAVTVADQRAERAAATTDMVDEALTSEDPERATQFRRGMVGRYHYLETVEPIQQLKREGRLQEALAIPLLRRNRGGRTEQRRPRARPLVHRAGGDHSPQEGRA